uniref:Uncharacterized protein n=1 Tax=Vitrella brassicaformis TaxID=1169539 RepID=A0A7S1KAT3_9ALVE|mmetsp:Transcript_45734/g.113649  ORF Transcript_45734/g.113649 Transcript_45734/m.113649 type:complete len:118 (+) Transcript_45734:844-1197(+)
MSTEGGIYTRGPQPAPSTTPTDRPTDRQTSSERERERDRAPDIPVHKTPSKGSQIPVRTVPAGRDATSVPSPSKAAKETRPKPSQASVTHLSDRLDGGLRSVSYALSAAAAAAAASS